MPFVVKYNKKIYKFKDCCCCKCKFAYLDNDIEITEYSDIEFQPYDRHYVVCPSCGEKLCID